MKKKFLLLCIFSLILVGCNKQENITKQNTQIISEKTSLIGDTIDVPIKETEEQEENDVLIDIIPTKVFPYLNTSEQIETKENLPNFEIINNYLEWEEFKNTYVDIFDVIKEKNPNIIDESLFDKNSIYFIRDLNLPKDTFVKINSLKLNSENILDVEIDLDTKIQETFGYDTIIQLHPTFFDDIKNQFILFVLDKNTILDFKIKDINIIYSSALQEYFEEQDIIDLEVIKNTDIVNTTQKTEVKEEIVNDTTKKVEQQSIKDLGLLQ